MTNEPIRRTNHNFGKPVSRKTARITNLELFRISICNLTFDRIYYYTLQSNIPYTHSYLTLPKSQVLYSNFIQLYTNHCPLILLYPPESFNPKDIKSGPNTTTPVKDQVLLCQTLSPARPYPCLRASKFEVIS